VLSAIQPEPVARVLNIGGIGGAWRGDGVDSAACRAAADMGFQYKGSAAPLAICRKAAIGDRPLAQGAAVGLRHKRHQFPPLRKRSTTPVPMPMSVSMPAATTTTI
jgi:hypothetical protein